MAPANGSLKSVCVFCGSSDAADPAYLRAAGGDPAARWPRRTCGWSTAAAGSGLMGATARAAHEAGGKVLGIIPNFLVGKERALETVEHEIVTSMHERKQRFFEESQGFVILPGGIGTLEEVIELLSWRRLDLHTMPVVFYNPDDFWGPLFTLFQHTVDAKLTPPAFMGAWTVVDRVEDIVPALLAGPKAGASPMLSAIS